MTRPIRPAPPDRLRRLARGLGALIVLVAVVLGIPILMASLHLVPHSVPSPHQLGHDLTQRDDGQLAVIVIAAGVWICWALFTLSLIPELAALAGKRPSRPLPGLSAFQRPAGALVAAVALGFTITPLIAAASGAPADAAAPPLSSARPTAAAVISTAAHIAPVAADVTARGHPVPENAAAPTYQVQRHDTLWKIAEDHLDDPMRYPEIVALNPSTIGPDNEIITGTVLILPADAAGPHAPASQRMTEVRVERGDTLWSIEKRHTGSGANWHAGWEANAGRAEPGGERFENPNLIKLGWRLSIPISDSTPSAGPAPTTRTVPPESKPPTPPPSARPEPNIRDTPPAAPSTPGNPADANGTAPKPASHVPARADTHQAQVTPENRYVWMEAGGGLLAATSFAALMVHRRRKFRHRRPGHVVASLPPDLMPLGRALTANGRTALPTMRFLDLALRDLAERISTQLGGTLPDIVGAGINDDYLELYLTAESAAPPEPWLATDPLRWALARDTEFDPVAGRRLAPYPCLVSVGYSDDGTEYLLDLEHAGTLQLVGDPARCLDLARYLVAELANNTWSDHLTVTAAGFAHELVAANPTRLAYTADAHAAAAALARVAGENREVADEAGLDVLEGRLRGTDGDVWMPHVLLAAPGALDEQDTDLLQAATGPGRGAVAVVFSGDDASGETTDDVGQLEVTGDGSLVSALLPVGDVAAFGLPVADAEDLARAIALDRDGILDEPTPASAGDQPWDAFTDAAGALRAEYTLPRATAAPDVIDSEAPPSSSLLPELDDTYLASATTTAQDLAELAPAVTARTRAAVEQADPELDELLAAWNDPDATLAKLQVLGPVTVTAYGHPPAKQEDFCTEIVAYLWSKPNGVSTDKFANDLWPQKNYTGTDSYPKDMASRVRHWLGIDPRTGKEYWPRARRDGVQGYHLDGLLCDYDLFRRLRVRGEARGADGLPDLVAALDLVSGTPLSQLRPFGYGWLSPGDELLYQGAIAEVAHLVATSALKAGDDAEAIRACGIALQIDPVDDRALLTMAKAHEHAGRDAEKNATILRLTTLEDPPARTLEVMRRNGWLARGA